MKEIDKLALIEIRDRKILSTRSKAKDTYYIPGGKREGGESDQDALIREIKEELSVDLERSTLEFFGVFEAQAHGQSEGVIVRMTCYTGSYTGELRADSEIAEIVWLEYKDKINSSPVDNIIFDYCKGKGLID
jgi:8-oxo-dGTP diphosphatase